MIVDCGEAEVDHSFWRTFHLHAFLHVHVFCISTLQDFPHAIILSASRDLSRGAVRCRSGTNNSAMFAEIVPEQLRSAVYAFDRSFEGAVGATGAPLVGEY